MITQAELHKILDYDPNTGIFRWKKQISQHCKSGKFVGSLGNHGYYRIGINRKNYLAHRLAWLYMTGNWPTNQIDHINQDKKDNRWINLRQVNNAQNQWNIQRKGAYWHKASNKWSSKIQVNKKQINLGLFDTEQEAADAYQAAKLIYHKI